MTGFGQGTKAFNDKRYRIEIKSLNGKTTDIRFKSTTNLRNRELELRKMILSKGLRGKFEVNLTIDTQSGSEELFINKELMNSYYDVLNAFAKEKGIQDGDMIQSIIRLPNIVQVIEEELSNEEWEIISEITENALEELYQFRAKEGERLKEDVLQNVNNISELLKQVGQYESERIVNLKERIRKNLNQHMAKENIDENRFEQEILFYLEKLDINEEKVRLAQHCLFFSEEANKSDVLKGKNFPSLLKRLVEKLIH